MAYNTQSEMLENDGGRGETAAPSVYGTAVALILLFVGFFEGIDFVLSLREITAPQTTVGKQALAHSIFFRLLTPVILVAGGKALLDGRRRGRTLAMIASLWLGWVGFSRCLLVWRLEQHYASVFDQTTFLDMMPTLAMPLLTAITALVMLVTLAVSSSQFLSVLLRGRHRA